LGQATIRAIHTTETLSTPIRTIAKANRKISRKTVRLAEKLDAPVVIEFSGCLSDTDNAKLPNWITCPWSPEYLVLLDAQPVPRERGAVAGNRPDCRDPQIYPRNLPLTGVLDTNKYTHERNRACIFRTVGYGHGAEWWSEFISTLRIYQYDYVLSIEHEDSLLVPEEGLSKAIRFLDSIVIRKKPSAAWWV
jgi:sugar phosphate isomerase/epimerase